MITAYFGKSCSGKNYSLESALATGNVEPIVTYTTRPMRVGEENGIDYNFVSVDKFKILVYEGFIFESRAYNTAVKGKPDVWYYGSPKVDAANKNYATILDIEGIRAYIKEYGAELINPVFVDATDAIRLQRARMRGGFDAIEWNRRLEDDEFKFSRAEVLLLAKELGRPITVLNNNGTNPTFSQIG